MPKPQHQTPPRDVIAMLHLLSRWLQTQGVQELRIEPGKRGSDEARVTRYVRQPIVRPPTSKPTVTSGRGKPRRLRLSDPSPVERAEAITDLLPLTFVGGMSGLTQIRLARRCARCHQKQFVEEFNRQRGTADGRSAYCRRCKQTKKQQAERRRKNLADPTVEARLWSRVNKDTPTGCWEWTGNRPKHAHSYATINFHGAQRAAHLVAWELLRGPVPKTGVCHRTCGNNYCLRPDHMIFVTRRELSLRWAKDNPFQRNGLKAKCHVGHEFTPKNTHYFLVGRASSRVCLACLRIKQPGTKKKSNRPTDAVTCKAGKLMQKAEVLLGKFPPLIRDIARSCVMLEILAGNVTPESLPAAIKKAKTEAWRDMPDKWKNVSLNEPIGDEGRDTYLDYLPDESQLSDPLAVLELAEEERG